MRKIFLPLLWERFDVYSRGGNGAWYKQVSKALEVKSKRLTKNKELASYVQSCHVVLTRCSTATVSPAFARCLESLPNLHTLEILHAHSQMTTALKSGFEGITITSVRTIIPPSCAHNILRCCPEVRSVKCTEENGSKLIGAIASSCFKVEVLEDFQPDAAMMKRLVKGIPNLRRFVISGRDITPDLLMLLKPMKKLAVLEFPLLEPNTSTVKASACIKTAQEILRKSDRKSSDKHLKVRLYRPEQWDHSILERKEVIEVK